MYKNIVVNENGTYNAENYNCDGFDKVKVMVDAGSFPPMTIHGRVLGDYNRPIELAPGTSMDNTFYGATSLNQPVVLPENSGTMWNTFRGCSQYNQPTVLPNTGTCYYTFAYCNNFNAPITFGVNTTNISGFLFLSENYNCPLNFPDTISVFGSALYGCKNFNAPVKFSNSMVWSSWMFHNCFNFNQSVDIISPVLNVADHMFQNCYNFNSPVNLPETTVANVNTIGSMFENCYNFNAPVNLGHANYNSIGNLFYGCANFNQPVELPNSVDWHEVFRGCIKFNQPVNIPSVVQSIYGMFSGCVSFNQPITVSSHILSMSSLFASCYSLNSPIYVYADNVTTAYSAFVYCNILSDVWVCNAKNIYQFRGAFCGEGYFNGSRQFNRINVHADQTTSDILRNTDIVPYGYGNNKPVWTDDPDNGCYYNIRYNIYIYNDWDGIIPA